MRHIIRCLKLQRVSVVSERLEHLLELRPAMRESSDLALARAVAPPDEASAMALPFLKPGGTFLAQLGTREEADHYLNQENVPGFVIVRAVRVPPCVGRPGRQVLVLKRSYPPGEE